MNKHNIKRMCLGMLVLIATQVTMGHSEVINDTAKLNGRVTYNNGKPAAGVQVRAKMQTAAAQEILTPIAVQYAKEHPGKPWVFPKAILRLIEVVVTTRRDGTYSITGLAKRPYNLMVVNEPPGWVATAVEGVMASESNSPPSHLVLTIGAMIRGRVVDKNNRRGLPNVRLWLSAPHRPQSSNNLIELQTDKNGRFAVRVASGKTRLFTPVTTVGYVPNPKRRENIEVGLIKVKGIAYLETEPIEMIVRESQVEDLVIQLKSFAAKRK